MSNRIPREQWKVQPVPRIGPSSKPCKVCGAMFDRTYESNMKWSARTCCSRDCAYKDHAKRSWNWRHAAQ